MTLSFNRLIIILIIVSALVSCKQEKTDEKKPVKEKKKEKVKELPFTKVGLDNLEAFAAVAGETWILAEDVTMDRNQRHDYAIKEGKGVLVSQGKGTSPLLTKFQYADADIKLDFMLSEASGATLYLQGRYAVHLTDSWRKGDSWHKDSLLYNDCGGIETAAGHGIAPSLNACKAPGLWQHLYVRFKAPRFDSAGHKIADASFEQVTLNGKVIAAHITVTAPSAGAVATDEKDVGPLAIAASNGPVAFRDIQYKVYTDERITLSNMEYAMYKGLFKSYDTLKNFTPVRTGKADSLTWEYGEKRAQITLNGTMTVPVAGDYMFRIRAGGAVWLLIDDHEVVDNGGTREYIELYYGKVTLTKGNHTFRIIHANYDESLVLEYEGPGIPVTTLTAPTSERHQKPIPPMEYVLTGEPMLQRGFFSHHDRIDPYTVAVGTPVGMNYAYDLTRYSILSVWRGRFIDVSNMWEERGETQREIPLGALLELDGMPCVLQLEDEESVWPDTVDVENNIYTNRGYHLNYGLPVFTYTYKDIRFEDDLAPSLDNGGFIRTITATFNKKTAGIYFLLGSGKYIEALPNGAYAMDDKAYYIEAPGVDIRKHLKIVKAADGRYELLLPLNAKAGSTLAINYSIVW